MTEINDLLKEVQGIFPDACIRCGMIEHERIVFWIEDMQYSIWLHPDLHIAVRYEGEGKYTYPFPFTNTKDKIIAVIKSIAECRE